MTNNNILFLKGLCFEQFKTIEKLEILKKKQFEDRDETIRNDQICTELSKTVLMLDNIIKRFIDIAE